MSFVLNTQMVSLANEVQSYHLEKKKEVSDFTKSPVVGGLSHEPSLCDIISYSYCYVGIMTGILHINLNVPECFCVFSDILCCLFCMYANLSFSVSLCY